MTSTHLRRRAARALGLALLGAVLPLALASAGHAQIVAIHLKDDEKVLKKYADRLVRVNGKPSVLGELRTGITFDGKSFSGDPKVAPEIWVADPGKPELEAYALDRRGKIKAGSKKCVLRLDWSHIQEGSYAAMMMLDETLPSLSREYVLRRDQIDRFKDERDEFDRTTNEWSARHARVIAALEGLQTWLRSTLWPKYADSLQREIDKEARAHKGAALRLRHDQALDSLTEVDVPAELAELVQEISDGQDTFLVRETQHLRIYFTDRIEASAVEEALVLGEEIIEGFRSEFVDPFVDDEFADHIPDGVFHEFLFTPEGDDAFVEYSRGLFGVDWSQNRAARIEMGGGQAAGDRRRPWRTWWKFREPYDLRGNVAHAIGHSLGGFHYGRNGSMNQDWLSEAIGYHLSFSFLGRNSVTCKQFGQDPAGYVKREREVDEGEKTVGEGRRELYNRVALELGRPIDQLARRSLFEMDDADLAKAWSFFDYVVRAEGRAGQEWLRAAARASVDEKSFLADWREAAAEILGVPPGDAFRVVEERWREFAASFGAEED